MLRRVALAAALGTLLGGATAGRAADPDAPSQANQTAQEEEDETPGEVLRDRLTEREDKRRPEEPMTIDLLGHPFTFGGEYELELLPVRRRLIGDDGGDNRDRLLLDQSLEAEVFYTIGPVFSLFAQAQLVMEEDLLRNTFEGVSDLYVEREEMWIYSENLFGSHVNVDLGRLDFEDDRRWWWDADLDAIRFEYEKDAVSVALALAYELGPSRSDLDDVEPEHDGVLRLIGEASWDWREGHSAQLFFLHANDRSSTERIHDVVTFENEDDSDATLAWVGARATGVSELRRGGDFGYWLDTAFVAGQEKLLELDPLAKHRSVVSGRGRNGVRGWGIDAGVEWFPPLGWEPRLFAGYAIGSGDSDPGSGGDHAFQQTGLEANEAGFGGVERFAQYGVLLDPELSNLGVLTLGAGMTLLDSSSLDLVYHHYTQFDPATELRDAALEFELTGRSRDVGDALDLVVALEEWERFELEVIGSVFRGGSALGEEHGTWSAGGLLALRIAF